MFLEGMSACRRSENMTSQWPFSTAGPTKKQDLTPRFNVKEDVASNTIIKSSTQRMIRLKLLQQFPVLNLPLLNPDHPNPSAPTDSPDHQPDTNSQQPTLLEFLWPKKEPLNILKCRENVSILVCKKTALFFQHFDGPVDIVGGRRREADGSREGGEKPDPKLLPQVQVDRGAIKYVLSGANIMCPGLTSPGARLPDDLAPHTPVAVHAEGKLLPCAIGLSQKSAADIRQQNKGVGLDNLHWLGDDLWLLHEI
ncbi:hypothetical protein VP01_2936g2 [Puccinia sorghi]|uniref:PUA domain-containing protein n=1 Tax=Puccinia sorghi TaxID=27349 RepID=A0A0L6V144_9BASI|nr:hypothetical protein VP01_2936g2 [Puccinia sorghi]